MSSTIDKREQSDMGRTVVSITITNAVDRSNAAGGLISPEEVRCETLDVLVDSGATYLSLPPDVIERLGLVKNADKQVRTANGVVARGVYSSVWLELMGRAEETPVMEVPAGVPPLLGYFPLEQLDLVVNPKQQRLEGNPANDGKYILDQL